MAPLERQAPAPRPCKEKGVLARMHFSPSKWLGLIFLLVLAFPLKIGGSGLVSVFSVLNWFLLIGLGLLAGSWLVSHRVVVGDRLIFVILLSPWIATGASLLWTHDFSVTLQAFINYGGAVVAFLLVAWLFSGWRYMDIVRAFALFIIAVVATAVISYIPGSPLAPEVIFPYLAERNDGFLVSYYARFSHPFWGASNSFASLLALTLPLSFVALRNHRLFWPVLVITLSSIIASMSRGVIGSMMLVGLGFVVRAFLVRNSIPTNIFLLTGTGGLLASAFLALSPDSLSHLGNRLSFDNINARVDIYRASLGAFLEHYYWLGVGGGVEVRDISGVDVRSVHNSYIQNVLWYGAGLGSLVSLLMMFLPFSVFFLRVTTKEGRRVRSALFVSLLFLALINVSQASWEGSLVRVLIYTFIAFGVVMIRSADRACLGDCHEMVAPPKKTSVHAAGPRRGL